MGTPHPAGPCLDSTKPAAHINRVPPFGSDPSKAARNAAWHGVTFAEAEQVFAPGVVSITRPDPKHSAAELRYQTLGPIASGRVLLVVWTARPGDVIRIISARPASRRERRLYAAFIKGTP